MFTVEFTDSAVGLLPFSVDVDLVVFDVDDKMAEIRREQVSAHSVRGAPVELSGVAEKVDVREGRVGAKLQALDREFELFPNCFLLDRGAFDAFADLRKRQGAGCGEFDESLLLRLELVELLAKLRFCVTILGEKILNGLRKHRLHALNRIGAQAFSCNDGENVVLDLFDPDPRHRALLALFGGADEVLIGSPVSVDLAVHQAACAAGVAAVTALQHALQLVEVNYVAVALAFAPVEHFLHLEEGLLRYQWLVERDHFTKTLIVR